MLSEVGPYLSTLHFSSALNVSNNPQILPFRLAVLHLEFLMEVQGVLAALNQMMGRGVTFAVAEAQMPKSGTVIPVGNCGLSRLWGWNLPS